MESGRSEDEPKAENPYVTARPMDGDKELSRLATVVQEVEGKYNRGGYRVATGGRAEKGSVGTIQWWY